MTGVVRNTSKRRNETMVMNRCETNIEKERDVLRNKTWNAAAYSFSCFIILRTHEICLGWVVQ